MTAPKMHLPPPALERARATTSASCWPRTAYQNLDAAGLESLRKAAMKEAAN